MFSLHKPVLIETNLTAQKSQITLTHKTESEIQDYKL